MALIFGGKVLTSMDAVREGYLKRERERESRCRLLVMSYWPDYGVLVMRWKKANEARCTKLSLMILPERLKNVFSKLLFSDSLSIIIREILRTADITYTHYCCLSAI